MNYLSHYFLDAKTGQPYYNFGLVLPDMLGASLRGWKPDLNIAGISDEKIVQLTNGIKQHYKVDAFFHSSAFFTENTVHIRKIFEANGFVQTGTRLFFVAHIFLEFMLDRFILQDQLHKAKHFYEDIYMVDAKILQSFLENTSTQTEGFFKFLESFLQHKYLYAYLQDERLFYALNRTLQRGRQQVFPEDMLPAFQLVIQQTSDLIYQSYKAFFKDMYIAVSE